MITKKMFLLFFCMGLLTTTQAKIQVPNFFSSHMVLQQNESITIYGVGNIGEKITAIFKEETKNTVTDRKGNWSVTFSPSKFGGPYIMTLKGDNTIQFSNVYVGEVWFCSGQSNMGWRLENSSNGKEEVKNSTNDQIKLFQVTRVMSGIPNYDVETRDHWRSCKPRNAKGFSAVAYLFGKELYEKYKVPIGLINSSWGGTDIEAWMNGDLFTSHPERKRMLSKMKTLDLKEVVEEYNTTAKSYDKMLDDTNLGIQQNWEATTTDYSDWKTFKLPSVWSKTALKRKRYGIVWVTKTINLSASDITADLLMSLGRIDDQDVTYVNGQKIGASTKKDLVRRYIIPKELLKEGKNRITINTKNLMSTGGFRGAAENLYLKSANRKIPLAGNWNYKVGTPGVKDPPVREHPRRYPSSLYNGMVHPFFKYKIKGIIWYQGESNTKNPEEYAEFFPKMITNWRKGWDKELPFLFVQLPNLAKKSGSWPPLREAQAAALKLKNVGMVTAIDVGDDSNIHPINKTEVSSRLVMLAQNIAYEESNIPTSGPVVKKVKFKKGKVTITFDSEIIIKGDASKINGFLISKDNLNFIKINAKKVNNYAVEICDENIKQVRYLWEDAPGTVMIFNKSGLPGPPFKKRK